MSVIWQLLTKPVRAITRGAVALWTAKNQVGRDEHCTQRQRGAKTYRNERLGRDSRGADRSVDQSGTYQLGHRNVWVLHDIPLGRCRSTEMVGGEGPAWVEAWARLYMPRGDIFVISSHGGMTARFVPNPLPSSFWQSLPIRSKIEPLP